MDYDLENLISLIAEEGMIPRDEVTPEKTFAELGFDSLDHIQLIGECEHHFGVEIPEQIANAALTVAALHAAVTQAFLPVSQPCPYCHQPPVTKQNDDGHYLECSNQIDCPGWPYTEPHPTQALAIAAWNSITREDS